jgi:hypothetical protein
MLPAGVPEQTRNNILGSSTQAQGVCVVRSGAYVADWCLNRMSELIDACAITIETCSVQ